jgi:hypothetical protein
MITETQATIQTIATVESLVNPIDRFAVLDRQIKELEAQREELKNSLINELGEGKFHGEQYGVELKLTQRIGSVNYTKLFASFGIEEKQYKERQDQKQDDGTHVYRGATTAYFTAKATV